MNRRRLTIYLIGVALGCVILMLIPRRRAEPGAQGASPWQPTVPEGYYPHTFTDDAGREVTIEKQPRLFVALAPSVTDAVVDLGLAGQLVGVTKWADNPAVNDARRIGSMDVPDIERILAMRADLVLGTEMTPPHVYDKLQAAGIPAYVFKHEGLDDVFEDMRRLAVMVGAARQGGEAVRALEQRRQAVLDKVPAGEGPTVAVLYDVTLFGSAGPGSWVDDMLKSLNMRNIAAESASAWPRVSREALLQKDPDWIIMHDSLEESGQRFLREQLANMKADPLWSRLSALQNDQVIILEPNMLNVPGPRSVRAMEAIADAVYGRAEEAAE